MFLQVTPILCPSYAFLPSVTSRGCGSGFFSSSSDALADVGLVVGGVSDGFSVCARTNTIICYNNLLVEAFFFIGAWCQLYKTEVITNFSGHLP